EANLAQHVFLLRQTFTAHSPHETFIVTAARHGYRFVAPVHEMVADVRGTPAWSAYVRGRFLADQRTRESLIAGLRAYEEALRIDERFVPALSGLASCRVLQAEYLFEPPEVMELARAAAQRAAAIDPSDVEAQLALGDVAWFYDWNAARALEHYERAVWLDPASTRVRVFRTWFFGMTGEYDRAQNEIEIALRREAFSLELLTTHAALSIMRQAFLTAVQQCEDILDMSPGYDAARYYRRVALAHGGSPAHSLKAFDSEEPTVEYRTQSLGVAGYAAALAGDQSRAQSILAAIDGSAGLRSSYNVAYVLAGLGRLGDAAEELERGIDRRDAWSVLIGTNPALRSLPAIDQINRRIRDGRRGD
ncbi:MAG TPA: hypothetical protein VKB39_09705, partial [Candidatus Baltobacteraceae bacterium]|nr:hypothetical protein [Candidatus Baltobacteraceae bacterium]